jgi:hypothetical protein
MTRTIILKVQAAIIVLLILSVNVFSQTCEVNLESIKGTYTGDCKKNKAHGKGKAVGTDTYEGEFKNGVPDGEGTYTWSNKSVFVGKYVKGFREGKGMMTIKSLDGKDSILEGYWKKDVYIGTHEKPWEIISKTGSITKVEVEHSPGITQKIKIVVTNTTGGVSGVNSISMRFIVENVLVSKGFFERRTSLETHLKSTETTLTNVTFPFRAKFQISGGDEVEIEFFEQGSYTVDISVNK